MDLREVQGRVALDWTEASYGPEFRSRDSSHKNFEHALIHVLKASGKLAAMVDAADHGTDPFNGTDVAKYLADLIICTARMANTTPFAAVDLSHAVEFRLGEIRKRA